MPTYLLLRDNKETGPYSLDELLSFGLKPYDLVWVNAKSAAWRYPSEVVELKAYAPEVEEQPFDRFYKKPATEKIEEVIEKRKELFQKQTTNTPRPVLPAFTKEEEKYIPKIKEESTAPYAQKRTVFVTLPGKSSATKIKQRVPVKPVATYAVTDPESDPVQTISITENPATTKIKYSQPLDEIKEMYVKTLHDRKNRIARKSFWIKNLKVAAVVALLISIGVAVGLGIQGATKSKVANSSPVAQTVPQVIEETKEEALAANPGNAIIQEPIPQEEQQAKKSPSARTGEPISKTPDKTVSILSEKQNEELNPDNKQHKSTSKNADEFLKKSEQPKEQSEYYPGTEVNASTGERIKKTRSDNSPVTGAAIDNKPVAVMTKSSSPIDTKVEVSSNDYQRVALGGIRNLQLTITNDSKYALDNVMVELQYLRPNELPLKTENITFRSVAAHGSSTLKVPDTNRGIKVTYKIIHIKSQQLDDELANR